MDAGIDNDCDGSVDDPVAVSIDVIGKEIAGEEEGAAFGTTLLAVPAGWVDDEEALLAAAPFGAATRTRLSCS